MKTKLLFWLLLVAQLSFGQATNDALRMNISIGAFSSGTIGDYTGPVGVVGSTGFTIDSVTIGDILIDDLHNRYSVAAITIIVQGSSATLELNCLDSPCVAPQIGKGAIFRGSPNLGLELLTENGSNFITEALEAKILTHNFLEIDRYLANFSPASIKRYSAGSGVYVTASGQGVTASKSAGLVTIVVPSTVNLQSFRIVGGASDLNSGELRIVIQGGAGSGTDFNTSDADLYHPSIFVQNRTVILATDPYLQRPDDAGDSITLFDERFANAGEVAVKITGLSGDFGIKGQL